MAKIWKTSRRVLFLDRPLVMGILNVTPDSFSDGGRFFSAENAVLQAEKMIAEGADIIDIGGESTRPGSSQIDASEEIRRVVPVIEKIRERFDIPVSVDTSKSAVADAALQAGAEIVNDISGLRWDGQMAKTVATHRSGLVLMHSRGLFENMHGQPPVAEIFDDVKKVLGTAIENGIEAGIERNSIALDPGIGFGKALEQNLGLLARLNLFVAEFPGFPVMVGTSRKSFIGKILGGASAGERLGGSLATSVWSVIKGANILRVHDVKLTADAIKLLDAIQQSR